jgi:chitin synthase
MNYHISKVLESLLGSVTCLPSCFSLYCIKLLTQQLKPHLTLPQIIQDHSENDMNTLHMKNLLYLGENHYLTTLMLKYFSQMKLAFMSDAQCCRMVSET